MTAYYVLKSYVRQLRRILTAKVVGCDPRCRAATGSVCDCRCEGRGHGCYVSTGG